MTDTINLGLPCIEGSQAQKHVTHNEALHILDTLVQLAVLDRDLTAPPGSVAEGQRWIVKPTGSGVWAGHNNAIAAWQDGAWQFSAPQTGWLAYVVDEGALLAWTGSAWADAITALTSLNNMTLLGLGTMADATNPFSAKLNHALFAAKTAGEGGSGDLRYKLSKESAAKTLSLLFQDNYSGRAEIGLTGDNDFHLKVSPDGSSWADALIIDRTTGGIRFLAAESDVASASTCDIGSAPSLKVQITGTTAITSLGTVPNCLRFIRFAGALTLTYNATSLILPTGASFATAAGDCAIATSDASGNWRVRHYQRADGTSLAAASSAGGMLNKFRNATMDVWQRGTSMTVTTSGAYTADGWIVVPAGASVTAAQAGGRLLTKNSLKVTGAASVTDVVVKQRIESLIAAAFCSQTVTVQANIYNNTGGSITPTLTVKHAASPDSWGSSTTDVNAANLQSCANGAWTQVAYTFAADASSYNGLEISFDFGNNFGSSAKSVQIAELDIRVTSAAAIGLNGNPPVPELRQVGVELSLNRRYYFRRASTGAGDILAIMQAYSSDGVFGKVLDLPAQMRAAPTVNLSSASHLSPFAANGGASGAFTSVSGLNASQDSLSILGGLSGSSGLAAGNASTIKFNTSSGWIDASAEL